MPNFISFGAGSIRAFGGLNSSAVGPSPPPPPPPPPPTPTVVTFTESGTWVANTSSILVLTGQGGNGEPAGSAWIDSNLNPTSYSYETSDAGGSVDNTPYYYQLVEYGDSVLSSINYSTAERTVTYSRFNYFYNPSTQKTIITSDFSTHTIRGLAYKSGSIWNNTSSNPVQGIGNGWYLRAEQFFSTPETTGAASTALGYSFPGGTGGAASPVTYNSVPVNFGQTYTINVGAGGFVTLEYY